MNIQNYGKISSGRDKKIKKKIKGIIIILLIILAGAFIIGVLTDDGPEYQKHASVISENRNLKAQVAELQSEISYLQNRVAELEGQVIERDEFINSLPTESPEESTDETTENNWEQDSPRSE